MRTRAILSVIAALFLVSGCATRTTHPDYAIFRNVPATKVNAIKSDVKKADIKHIEFPTYLPYKVTWAVLVKPATPPIIPALKHSIQYYIGSKDGRYLAVQARDTRGKVVNPNVTHLSPNQTMIKLGNGTKALFGNNSAVNQLDWISNGVEYNIASGKGKQSRPDLTMKQLIQVANSFS